jgi:hypothetical protein
VAQRRVDAATRRALFCTRMNAHHGAAGADAPHPRADMYAACDAECTAAARKVRAALQQRLRACAPGPRFLGVPTPLALRPLSRRSARRRRSCARRRTPTRLQAALAAAAAAHCPHGDTRCGPKAAAQRSSSHLLRRRRTQTRSRPAARPDVTLPLRSTRRNETRHAAHGVKCSELALFHMSVHAPPLSAPSAPAPAAPPPSASGVSRRGRAGLLRMGGVSPPA